MLTLTDQAASIVTAIVTNQSEAEQAGLRIHEAKPNTVSEKTPYALQIVPEPSTTDTVIPGEGSPVYLDEHIADDLDDKVLDAAVDAQGGVTFKILVQD